ncbi:DUF2322 family protein [Candidatus Pacearchaeota archaeon]|nr:DUF2322 family protein [Candidatus Pacearchaeota archaeon]
MRGLEIFGQEFREEARTNPRKHPNIELLERIVELKDRLRVDVIRNYEFKPIPYYIHEALPSIIEKFGTPFHIYDEPGIISTGRMLNQVFSWVPMVHGQGFRNYFAVKALPNPRILEILKREGMGADCSSYTELKIADAVGFKGKEMMFTSNDTPEHEFRYAKDLGAIINFDDLTHIDFFLKHVGDLPELVCCRYNPGELKEGNSIIGSPTEAKYGFTREQLFDGYRKLRERGIKRFGLHTMVASNELNPDYFVETAGILFGTVRDLSNELNIKFEFVNMGGGIGTPYKPEQKPIDLSRLVNGIFDCYHRSIESQGLSPIRILMENGRFITGPHGYLVSKVLHVAKKHKDYVGLDACMANLMRPAMYGAYHEITVLGKEKSERNYICDVSGSLCENNDKFAINRSLPEVKEGDFVVIHNTGAHGHSMGFNYNGKLRSQELLFKVGGDVELIRRAETPEDYFSTLNFNGSRFSSLASI